MMVCCDGQLFDCVSGFVDMQWTCFAAGLLIFGLAAF